MKNEGLAKTNKKKTIKEHTQDLLEQYQILKEIYPNILKKEDWEILELAIKYHDLGKINTKFQNKLYQYLKYDREKWLPDNSKDVEQIPHNFLSTSFIDTKKMVQEYGITKTQILVSAVYYHHNRKEKEVTQEAIEDLKEQSKAIGNFYDINFEKIRKCSKRYILNSTLEEDIEIIESKDYIQIKGLLNKIDYVASMDKENVKVEESSLQNGKTVAEMIQQITKNKYKNIYRPVQKYMQKYNDENVVVVSYTGSGKTEAALLWIQGSKAFYTLPLKVSINAMYKRITEEIKYKKALLLHSDAYSYYVKEYDEDLNMYDRARRMSSPLIITTVDQLFKIAFRYKGYEEILATLSYSKIVIDEIQMYTPQMIAYIMIGLSMITKAGGKFAIITATFPPFLYSIMDKLRIPYHEQEEEFTPHIQNRHKIEVLQNADFDIEKIKEKAKDKKVLVIVNTVRKAQQLYQKLENEKVHLLHSHYLKEDRDLLEKDILRFGMEGKEEGGIWISTQIVEASLDIDFDVLFTDMCTIDSLLQRMGRVYRKRLYDKEEANIYIYDNRNGVPYVVDSEIYGYTLKEIKQYHHKNLSETDKQQMIQNIYSLQKNEKLEESKYYQAIIKEINLLTEILPNNAEKKEIEEKFRNIQNVELIPDNIYDKLYEKNKIQEWEEILSSKSVKLKEKLQVKEEIRNNTISIRWSPYLIMDSEELFFPGSNIHRTKYQYEFNKKELTGKGLIMEKIEKGYFDE